MDCCSVLKAFMLIDRICCFFRRIYIWSTTIQIYFMVFLILKITIIRDKITIFHFCSYPIQYLERYDSKSSLITSSASSLFISSILPLFECIALPSRVSLEDIKIISIRFFEIIYYIFYVPLNFIKVFLDWVFCFYHNCF